LPETTAPDKRILEQRTIKVTGLATLLPIRIDRVSPNNPVSIEVVWFRRLSRPGRDPV
jgi:hypothetical protein